ncbi:Processive diacylglycerol beta-glucosyltransferase [Sporomusa carbonis]|uniref:MGDG synthase family glycosyltransferase n=1 Tax=Sporomusa carbonis TaxID=3076075 RepID=UPI003A67E58B
MANHRVLFISAPIGAGHIKAAQAVSRMMEVSLPDTKTELCNIFDFFSPAIGQTILNTYLKILDVLPQAYGTLYSWGNQSRLALWGRELISQFLARYMLDYIEKFQPSVIVCTHATPAGLVAWLKKRQLLTIPAVAVITDFVVHRLWVYSELDHYFVAHTGMAEYLEQYGISPQNISITGIPVSHSFNQSWDRRQLLNKLELAGDRKNVLIMGGGAGILPMEEIFTLCAQIDIPLQLMAVTGKNQHLYRKLNCLKQTMPHPVKVFGYVDNIYELMAAADLLISKPGGMSVSEALALGVPLIIYRPIPGQEEANTNYLLNSGAALRADSVGELKFILTRLLLPDSNELSIMRRQALTIGHPTACKDITGIIANRYFS